MEVGTSDTVTALVGGSVTMRNCPAGGFRCRLHEEQIHSGLCSILSRMATLLLLLLFAICVFFFLSRAGHDKMEMKGCTCLNCCSSFPWTSTRLTLNRRGQVYKRVTGLRHRLTQKSPQTQQHGRVERTRAWKEIIYCRTNRTCVG